MMAQKLSQLFVGNEGSDSFPPHAAFSLTLCNNNLHLTHNFRIYNVETMRFPCKFTCLITYSDLHPTPFGDMFQEQECDF